MWLRFVPFLRIIRIIILKKVVFAISTYCHTYKLIICVYVSMYVLTSLLLVETVPSWLHIGGNSPLGLTGAIQAGVELCIETIEICIL